MAAFSSRLSSFQVGEIVSLAGAGFGMVTKITPKNGKLHGWLDDISKGGFSYPMDMVQKVDSETALEVSQKIERQLQARKQNIVQ